MSNEIIAPQPAISLASKRQSSIHQLVGNLQEATDGAEGVTVASNKGCRSSSLGAHPDSTTKAGGHANRNAGFIRQACEPH